MITRLSIRSLVACALVALMLLPGCGSSPTAPSTTLNLAGTWTGTWQFTTSGANVTDTLTATISQSGNNATTSWSSGGGAAGALNFTVGSTISGTWTITQVTLTGTVCTATSSFSGTASTSAIDVTIATPASSGACQWSTGNQFSLRK